MLDVTYLRIFVASFLFLSFCDMTVPSKNNVVFFVTSLRISLAILFFHPNI